MGEDFQRKFYGDIKTPTGRQGLNYLHNTDPNSLYADLIGNMSTRPDPENQDVMTGLPQESEQFYKIREMLPQNIDSDPILKILDEVKESGFDLAAQDYNHTEISKFLNDLASIRIFDSEKFISNINLKEKVWNKVVKPYLDELVLGSNMSLALSNCYFAKVLFPKEFELYQLPENIGDKNFKNKVQNYLSTEQNWDVVLPIIEKLKFLGWEHLAGDINLSREQFNSMLFWLNKSSNQGTYFAQRVYYANLVRPANEPEIKLNQEQWEKCVQQLELEKRRDVLKFLSFANKLKYVQVAE